MNHLIKLFQKISYWYEVRKTDRYNKKLVRDLERVFERSGIARRVKRPRDPEEDRGKVYHVSFHNYRTTSSDNRAGEEK